MKELDYYLVLSDELAKAHKRIVKRLGGLKTSAARKKSSSENLKKAREAQADKKTIINGVEVRGHVKSQTVDAWIKAYDEDFVYSELQKAQGWLVSNPSRAPKSQFERFYNSWLSRGWEDYRKSKTSDDDWEQTKKRFLSKGE